MQTFALIGRDPKDRDATLLERQKRVDRFVESNATRAVGYVSSPPLRAAVDVALTLGRPLLLTGEPGSGKTLAAYWLAAQLGLPVSHVHRFQVRSDSRARDACYQFDAVSWFRDSQIPGKAVEKSDFVTPEALGKAFGWLGGEDATPISC
ncbi:hypothetical protein P6U16_25865 (plasmid) [Rhizobium sp. 32-5/1]|uniref:AAA family ATPase n=1 Tax=Rhizobium sp. 32-5/1 TaxID=3019602 RepID=UPI00240E5C9C|nr:AAA family ATPase [Rhizobium sp. 32-5/1]WEZ85497.1 hypothetical protein P6U16_25865 [Rhizobium sp. 32-5/1]